MVLGGYGLVKGGITLTRKGGDVMADIVRFAKDFRVREVEIPWASGVPDLDDLPSQINDMPISSKSKPSSSSLPAPLAPSSGRAITDRLPEIVVSRSDIDIEIMPYEGGVFKEYSVVIDGKARELGFANLSETGKIEAGIFFKRKIDGIETRIRIENTRTTDFVLEDAIATFESRYGRKPSNLGGSIEADNLANFQREFYQIRQQNPAMGEYEIAAAATRRISYGAARDRLGYSDFRFNSGNSFSYGDVFIDGILYRNVPKKVSIDAYRPKR